MTIVTPNKFVAAYTRLLGRVVRVLPDAHNRSGVRFEIEDPAGTVERDYWASVFAPYITALRSVEGEIRALRAPQAGR